MNRETIVTKGSRIVVINQQDGHMWANLYVNGQKGLQHATITPSRWTGKTVKGAQRWADKVMA